MALSFKQSLKTSLTDLINLKNLKTAFKFWEDRTYQEKCIAVLYFKSNADQKAPVPVYGLKEFCDFFTRLRFHPEYIHQLAAIREEGRAIFNESFLNQLQRFQFRFDLNAVPEGHLVSDADALLCLYASKIELKIIENLTWNFDVILTVNENIFLNASFPDFFPVFSSFKSSSK